jgi:hypothetical protein
MCFLHHLVNRDEHDNLLASVSPHIKSNNKLALSTIEYTIISIIFNSFIYNVNV